MSRMGIREYSRHRGCALSAVQKAITTGRISKGEDGRIDSDLADAAWAAHTDRAKQRKENPPAAAPAPPADPPLLTGEVLPAPGELARRSQFYGPDWPEPTPHPEHRPPAQVVDGDSFMAAKTRLAWAEVELREAAVAEKRGLSINGEAARQTFRDIGRIYASARGSVASEIAQRVIGLTDPNEIDRRVKAILIATDERIANEIFAKYPDLVVGHVERSGTGS